LYKPLHKPLYKPLHKPLVLKENFFSASSKIKP
jgi:hypothetical protein